ncbi:MAG TPA: transglycosylase SLT domain-containing protein [Burkholderiales bacterium]|nr:transglycosylase SLT domain-containing protein [Burkholderiales bacterium]
MRPLFLLAALLCTTVVSATPVQDEWFLHARDAYRAGSAVRLSMTVPRLQGHVLESYARYWQLKMNLEQAGAGEISEFLLANERSYVAEQLRKDWLKLLGKRQQWELFDAVVGDLQTEDADIDCYRAQRQWRVGNATGVEVAILAWNAPREIPDGCLPILEAEIAAGTITADGIWIRARRLNEVGQNTALRRTLQYLPGDERPDEKQLDSIARHPVRFLERAEKSNLRKRVNRELIVYALQRLAATDPEIAAGYWTDTFNDAFSAQDRAYVWGQFAWQAARKHLPQTLAWYRDAEGSELNTEQLQWRARAALRAGNWAMVRQSIDAMPELVRNEAAWVYWQGRALAAQGESEQAATHYQRIAGQPHFYGVLAQEQLGQTLIIPPVGHIPTAEELNAIAINAGLRRAIALFRADMWLEGVREWSWAIREMSDQQLLAAAEVARRTQLWDRVISTADRTSALHDYSLRYLAPYGVQFSAGAREQGLEEHWVLGLVRQESRFVAKARSPVGAQGLMQVMPSTAKWVARRIGLNGYRSDRVAEVDTNIALGTGYLRYVLDELQGSQVLAAAAYNAGPGRARKWKADGPLEGAIYAESIPFSETRDYVKKVMTNTLYYAALDGGDSRTLHERLGSIPGKQMGEGYAATITGETTVQ